MVQNRTAIEQPPFFPPVPVETPRPAPSRPRAPSRPGAISRAGRAVRDRTFIGVEGGGLLDTIGTAIGEAAGAVFGPSVEDRTEVLEAERETLARQTAAKRRASEISREIKLRELMRGAPPADPFRAQRLPGGALDLPPFGRDPIIRRMPRPPRSSASSSSSRRRPLARALQRLNTLRRMPLAQGLGAAFLVSDLTRGSSSTRAAIAPAIAPAIEPAIAPLTALDTRVAGFVGGFGPPSATSATCDCKPKKRGPRRKCLERVPVVFKSGRRKGKSAGTRCVRYAN